MITAMEKRMCGCGLRPKSKEERNAELRKDAARIVAGVENYSGADRVRRADDVKAAFPPVKAAKAKTTSKPVAKKVSSATAKTATKAAAKPASKGPASAGMSVGPHDGDTC